MEAPAGLERSVTKTAAMPFVEFFAGRGGVANLSKDIDATGRRRQTETRLFGAYRIQPCCAAARVCPQTRHWLAHTCAPQRLPIVCSCFAEKTEWLTVSSSVLSRPIPTPVWAACLPAVRSSLMPPPHGRSSRFHLGTSLRSRVSGLKPHPRSSSEPRLRSIFTCFPHTKTWSAARAFGKTCLPSRLSSRFVLRSRLFEMNFEVLAKAERAALHLHFCIFKKADYPTK